jgi:hypothetical protein
MKVLNKSILKYITLVIMLFFQISLIAQDNITEGVSEFSIKYIPKEKRLNTKDLMKTYGDTEKIYWTKDKLKRISLLKEDTLRISFTNHLDTFKCVRYKTDPFFYTKIYSTDSSIYYTKVDSNVLINDILCDTYKDSASKITAYLIKDKPFKFGYTSNFRDLIRLELERDNYTIVKEIKKNEYNIDTLNVFNIDKDKIVKPYYHCSNWDSIKLKLDQFRNPFYKMNKFPSYLIFKNLEGEVRLTFLINVKGKPINPRIIPIYYRHVNFYEKISNKRKINRITRIIEKRILKNYSECIASIEFDIPISNDEPTNILISLPLKILYYYRE